MPKLEKLTKDQEALIPVVRDAWITRALGGDASFDRERIVKGVEFVYSLAKLKKPQFTIVIDSPFAAQYAANILPIIFKAIGKIERGAQVWDQVRDQVGAQVGDQKLTWHIFDYNGYGADAGWIAFYDFFKRIGICDKKVFDQYVDFVTAGIWDCISFQNVSIVCRRPTAVRRDDRGFMHNSTGPAVEWADGYKNYAYHGVRVPEWVIENPEKINSELVLKEQNTEVRRCMIERMGYAKLMLQANPKILDIDKDAAGMPRRLLKIDLKEDEPLVIVEVNCPSTNHNYMLRVPPQMKTCAESVAWTYGFKASDYAPLVEA